MRIKDKPNFYDKPKPLTFLPDALVSEAIEAMCTKNIGSVIVTNHDDTIAGIVTERDLLLRVLGKKINPEETKISEIMTKNIKVANENDDLIDWLQTMSNDRFRHLPIVDDEGKLINLVSQGDFVALTWPDLYDSAKSSFKCRYSKVFQLLLVAFALVTLGLIAIN